MTFAGVVADQLKVLSRGVEEVLLPEGLGEKLRLGRPLRVKAGFDPTAPDLHFGHLVLLNKLKQFQDLGHEIYFLIGDFTGMIGDPTGKSITRKSLTKEQVMLNAKTYERQVFKVLDRDKTKIVFNSFWMDQLTSAELVMLASHFNVARMLEREDFKVRYQEGRSIAIHEFLYPILQGYDSVKLEADIELGGTDQKFNLLVGRGLQKQFGQDPQVVMTMPILEGLDGVNKMSKSLGNYIGILDAPGEMYSKILSVRDELIWRYFNLLSLRPVDEIAELRERIDRGENPQAAKKLLAEEFIARFHGCEAVKTASASAGNKVDLGVIPENIDDVVIHAAHQAQLGLASVVRLAGLAKNSNMAHALIKQGAVYVDGVLADGDISFSVGDKKVLQAGRKNVVRVVVVE